MARITTTKLGGLEAASSLSKQCPPATFRVEFAVTWHNPIEECLWAPLSLSGLPVFPKMKSTQHYFCKSLIGAMQTRVVWASPGNTVAIKVKSLFFLHYKSCTHTLKHFLFAFWNSPSILSTLLYSQPLNKMFLATPVIRKALSSSKNRTSLFPLRIL